MNRLWRIYTATYRAGRRVAPFWRVRRVTRRFVVLRSTNRIGSATYDAYSQRGHVVITGARTSREALDWAARARHDVDDVIR